MCDNSGKKRKFKHITTGLYSIKFKVMFSACLVGGKRKVLIEWNLNNVVNDFVCHVKSRV